MTSLEMKNSVSKRELEVLFQLSVGLSSKEVAKKLFISNHTVISHRKSLKEKLKARSAVELGVKAERLGLFNKSIKDNI